MDYSIRIYNRTTGEMCPIHRSVSVTHPKWVHDQLGTNSEVELQSYLDQCNVEEFYDDHGNFAGPDQCGLAMEWEIDY